jgi:hypothetical protein
MGKAKQTPADNAEAEKHRVGLEKLRIVEREKTKRLAILSFFGTVSLAIIAWAAVRMTDKPPWLVFALAILAAVGGPSIVMIRAERRLRREVEIRISRLGLGASEETDDAESSPTGPEATTEGPA